MTKETLQLLIENIVPVMALCTIAISVFCIVIFVLFVAIKKLKMKIKFNSIELNNEAQVVTENIHFNCIQKHDVVTLISDQRTMLTKENKIERHILKDQMKIVEGNIVRIMDIFMSQYIDLLTVWMGAPYTLQDNQDYRDYTTCLDKIATMTRSFYRECFQDDEISTIKDKNYYEYIDNSKVRLLKKITDIFDLQYHGKLVTRNKLAHEYKNIEPSIVMLIQNIFVCAREKEIQLMLEIELLEEEFKALLRKLF
jgi:uncharacterized protein with HEPN domain